MNKKSLLIISLSSLILLGCGGDSDESTNVGSSVFSFLDDKKIIADGLEGIWQQAAIQSDITHSNTLDRLEEISIKNFIRIEYNRDETQITLSDCNHQRTFSINNSTLTEINANTDNPIYNLNISDDSDLNGVIRFNTETTDNGLITTFESEAVFRMVKVSATPTNAIGSGSYTLNASTQGAVYDCYQQTSTKISQTENSLTEDYESTSVKSIAQDGFIFFIEDSTEKDSYILSSNNMATIEHALPPTPNISISFNSAGSQSTINDDINNPNVSFVASVNLSF